MNLDITYLFFKAENDLIQYVECKNEIVQAIRKNKRQSDLMYKKAIFLHKILDMMQCSNSEILALNESLFQDVIEKDYVHIQNINTIFQNFTVNQYLSVEENVLLPFYLSGVMITQEIKNKANEFLNMMGLSQMNKLQIHHLSKIELQKIIMIRILMCDHKIMNMNNCYTAIDTSINEILQTMNSMRYADYLEKKVIMMVTCEESLEKVKHTNHIMDACAIL